MDPHEVIQDRYELTEHLGRGGMADVWKARDRHLERDVAVKFIDQHLAEQPDFLVRFFSEAQAAARINHPNVVEVLDFGESEGKPFIVMEYVAGGAASALNEKQWRPAVAARVIAEAAAGAGAVHEAGMVHRDIKPGNILLGEGGWAKLADFGICTAEGREKLTDTGTAIGSPHYISPEQATGLEATPASDVYALGAVLYELLTGRPPFVADNVTAIAIAHVDKEPRPPSELAPEVPPALEAIVLLSLAKDPAQRPQNGTALAAALESVLEDSRHIPVAAKAPNSNRARLLIALAGALVIGGGIAIASTPGDDGASASTEQPNFDRNLDVDPASTGTRTPGADDEANYVEEPEPTPTKTKAAQPVDPAEEDVSDFEEVDDEEEPTPTPKPTPTPQPTEPTSTPEPSP